MGDKTGIAWTEATWNPTTGCSRVSEGCRNCYAEREAGGRLAHLPAYAGTTRINAAGLPLWTGKVNLLPERLEIPLRWTKPRMIFVNSMSDLFHEEIPDEFIERVFGVMAVAIQHTFQILTKRPERSREYFASHTKLFYPCRTAGIWTLPLSNVWLGVSVENQSETHRVVDLLKTPAAVRFVSAEPLLGEVDFTRLSLGSGVYLNALTGQVIGEEIRDEVCLSTPLRTMPKVDWLICGGESGTNARPMHPNWARKIRDDCVAAGVPYFFKQWGEWMPVDWKAEQKHLRITMRSTGEINEDWTEPFWEYGGSEPRYGEVLERVGKKAAGALLDGREWKEFPK